MPDPSQQGKAPATESQGPQASGGVRGVVPPGQHGGALLASLLAEHGVRHVFGVPGGQTLALYDAILDREPGMQHVLVRDERSAAYAADGYARVTGRAGVCDATVGPGAAKLPSGLGEALGASVPVVALVSELPARLAPHRYRSAASQALDQAALLAAVTKWHATVPDAATLPALVRQAFREATSGRPGPVALFLPQDVLDGPAPDYLALPPSRFGSFPAFRPWPDPDDVAAAAAVLRTAERPFILAGGGVLHSGAGAELTALAGALSAAVGTTLSGKGAIAEDHPLSRGGHRQHGHRRRGCRARRGGRGAARRNQGRQRADVRLDAARGRAGHRAARPGPGRTGPRLPGGCRRARRRQGRAGQPAHRPGRAGGPGGRGTGPGGMAGADRGTGRGLALGPGCRAGQ